MEKNFSEYSKIIPKLFRNGEKNGEKFKKWRKKWRKNGEKNFLKLKSI